ncbi:MAG TPA: AraC family transcriptional regulator [Flavitalea sp.]|nr:AraC family transcriptional regulator [Flavitalea sp.]
MMTPANTKTSKYPGIVYSYYLQKQQEGEQFTVEHGLCYIFSGELTVIDAGEKRTFRAGETLFYRKNFLAKFIKVPDENSNFRAITVIFDKPSLETFARQYGKTADKPHVSERAVTLQQASPLLVHYFQTLAPYFDTTLPPELIDLKRNEAIMLLLQVNPGLQNILFDFGQPGKIDLEAFMQQHFRFNVELKRFAYLTGRSLATFKRDFDKIFHTTPNRWLQQKRLEEAWFLIKEKQQRPSDVYHEVGFESLSHFSYSFKQFFGTNPSLV